MPAPDLAPEEDTELAPISSGLVFLEGQFIPPPYVLRSEGDRLLVNNHPILAVVFPQDREHRRGPRFAPSSYMQLERVSTALTAGNVILSLENQPLAILSRSAGGYQLLAALTDPSDSANTTIVNELPAEFDREKFQQWIRSYQPTPELHRHALALIEQVKAIEAESQREIAAVRRSDTLLYLVTVFGMVISVAATGHLLSAKPPSARDFVQDDPELVKMVSRSLGLVVVLSSLDLFWTIMASQAGKMIELNPIGSHLLHDPMQLIAVKAVVICGSVGLLYFLRHHRQAQTAAWWACLICTLLTFRWLTFNSMFV